MKKILVTLAAVLAMAGITGMAHAEIVGVTGITGHDGGNWGPWYGHLTDGINASNPSLLDPGDGPTTGMTLVDPGDPATWTWSGGYQQTWHANSILAGALNGKIGWVVMDFGSVVAGLENAYFWASGGTIDAEKANAYNLYYSSGAGIDTLPPMPQSKGTTGDYDFSSGDWTQIGSTYNLGTSSGALDSTVALGGISAQYIGIEILSLHGVDNRVAIGQIEITAVPPPAVGSVVGIR